MNYEGYYKQAVVLDPFFMAQILCRYCGKPITLHGGSWMHAERGYLGLYQFCDKEPSELAVPQTKEDHVNEFIHERLL